MKLTKSLKQVLKEARASDDYLFHLLNERVYDKSAAGLYNAVWKLAMTCLVGECWDTYADRLGSVKAKDGNFLVDVMPEALVLNCDYKKAKAYLKEAEAYLAENS